MDLTKYLDENKIGTRLLFAGNLTQKLYFEVLENQVASDMINTDTTMNKALWVGLYPGFTTDHLDYIVNKLEDFFAVSDF